MRCLRISTAIALTILVLARAIAAVEEPPEELYSRDQRYSVRILHSTLPGSNPDDASVTIAMRSGDRYISKYPTEGYLIDAFWSPDGKYVAVDNRRANSGDYLWVFQLRDGRAIKMPVDAGTKHPAEYYENYAEQAVKRVTAVYPERRYEEFNKLFTFAPAWTKSGELQVKTNLGFRNLPNQIAVIWETHKISNNKLVLIDERIEKAPWPPKKS
jgi:hypothetical protein